VEVIKGTDAAIPETDDALGNGQRFEIYFKHQCVLNSLHERAFKALGEETVQGNTDAETEGEPEADAPNADDGKGRQPRRTKAKQVKDPATAQARVAKAQRWMCRNFWDVRTFGAVMSTGINAGQVRGPVQITYARSVDRILPMDVSISRKSVTDEAAAEKQIRKSGTITGTFGRRSSVPYALYRGHGFVNAHLAMGQTGTGFTYGDLRLFFDAMLRMFDFNPSSSQGTLALRQIHLFEHVSPLGNARAFSLLERIRINPVGTEPGSPPARSFDAYKDRIMVDTNPLPSGILYYRLPDDWEKLFPSPATDDPTQ
jgi:CRISPR-associated protein Csd2